MTTRKDLEREAGYDFGRLGKYMRPDDGTQYLGDDIMKARMLEFYTDIIYSQPPKRNKDGKVTFGGVKRPEWQGIDEDLVYHFIHHWMWDRAKGITIDPLGQKGIQQWDSSHHSLEKLVVLS